MAAKITLTGMPTGPIVKTPAYYRFEMEEGGSPAAPKGLPSASTMTFSVLVSLQAGKKLGFPRRPAHRLLVQGELVADLPLSECPGELGVIAFKVEEILPKEAPEPAQPLAQPAPPTQPAVTQPPAAAKVWPDLSGYPMVPLQEIGVPDEFLRTPPRAKKTAVLQEQIRAHGSLDEPIVVEPVGEGVGYILKDGYRRYLIAQALGWTAVPVQMDEPSAQAFRNNRMAT